jgi:hypothetical protein
MRATQIKRRLAAVAALVGTASAAAILATGSASATAEKNVPEGGPYTDCQLVADDTNAMNNFPADGSGLDWVYCGGDQGQYMWLREPG